MSADTSWYVKVPVVSYEWIQVSAITRSDVRREYPEALEILHWMEYEEQEEA